MNKKNVLKHNGITLVALVITIIILLILAGISIATLTGSGLFEKARLAEQESKKKQEEEQSILGDYENKMAEYIDGTRTMNKNINYSKNEQVVGTWVNGEKLYKKTFIHEAEITKADTTVTNNYRAVNLLMGTVENLDKIVSIEGSVFRTDNSFMYNIPVTSINTSGEMTWEMLPQVDKNNNKIYLYIAVRNTSNFDVLSFKDFIMTVLYTKTGE